MNKEALLKEMREILDTMDVPELRKTDIFWLVRNLAFRNRNHPKYDRVIEILRQILNTREKCPRCGETLKLTPMSMCIDTSMQARNWCPKCFHVFTKDKLKQEVTNE